MRAHSSVSFIFLGIRKKNRFLILSLESITSISKAFKPLKGSLSFSQLFVTPPHASLKSSRFLLAAGTYSFTTESTKLI